MDRVEDQEQGSTTALMFLESDEPQLDSRSRAPSGMDRHGTEEHHYCCVVRAGIDASVWSEMESWTMGRVGRDPGGSGQGQEGPQYCQGANMPLSRKKLSPLLIF